MRLYVGNRGPKTFDVSVSFRVTSHFKIEADSYERVQDLLDHMSWDEISEELDIDFKRDCNDDYDIDDIEELNY